MKINKKISLLAIPVVAGLGAISVLGMSSAHAASQPVSASQQAGTDAEIKDAPATPETSSATNNADDPNGPNVEQTGQNESAN
jgi:hypothetical protein